MSKLQTWLSGLLALQLILFAAFLWADRPSERNLQQPLLHFTPAQVDRIVIHDGDQSATLARVDGNWQLPQLNDLPTKPRDVQDLLDTLQGLQTGWPVSTSSASHKRFHVAENENLRRISLYNGEELVEELLLGSSPGLNKVYLRSPGEEAVYTGELPTHTVPTDAKQWLDTKLLATGTVTAIQGADYHLVKNGDQWAFAKDDGEGARRPPLDTARAQELATKLGNLYVTGVAETPPEEADEVTLDEITLKVTTQDNQWIYHFSKTEDNYYVRRNDRDTVFTLTQYNYEHIAEVDRTDLVEAS